jgi:hypothetical protein
MSAHRIAILAAAALVAAMISYPPWQSLEGRHWAAYRYSWVFAPPNDPTRMPAAELGAAAKLRYPNMYVDLSDEELGARIKSKGPAAVSLMAFRKDVRIDLTRLGLQCFAVSILAAASAFGMKPRTN